MTTANYINEEVEKILSNHRDDLIGPNSLPQNAFKVDTSGLKALTVLTQDEDFDSAIKECIKVLQVKGDDYTIGTGDRLHNFKSVASFTGMTPEQVLGVYFYKHISAIFAYIKNGKQSESEPIEGRIVDAINYMLLFNKMVQERKRGKL